MGGQTEDGDCTIGTLEQLRAFEEAVHEAGFPDSTFDFTETGAANDPPTLEYLLPGTCSGG